MTRLLVAGAILSQVDRLPMEGGPQVYRCAATLTAITRALEQHPCILAVSSDLMGSDAGPQVWDLVHKRGTLMLVVMNKGHSDELNFLVSGCAGLLKPDISIDEVRTMLAKVMAGEIWAPPMLLSRTIRHLMRTPSTPKLSKREQQVFELISYGLTNQDVADRLYISRETVRWHMRSIYAKLGKAAVEGVREQFGLPNRGVSATRH